ncbi:hypothetical protein OG612_30975 [Streptomyces sp. NBC_01527]|uniref:hypothetical protein n=1 Tax=unclassified Streptomyces TaxID=2593676 RepID=UPI002E13C1BB|nr:hypothetical protein OG763_12400 [Streptomyces sp. NBC_01230]
MKPLTPNEELHQESLDELRRSEAFDVLFDEQQKLWFALDEFLPLSETKAEWADLTLSPELLRCSLRFKRISGQWRLTGSPGELAGEFSLPHLYKALIGAAPRPASDASESDRQLFSELRIIDSTPRDATGQAAFVRIQSGKEHLEIWYQDRDLYDPVTNSQACVRTCLSYCDYLDALRLTKGTFGWQLLFADVTLRDALQHRAEKLSEMIDTFPAAFPAHDYTALTERLEARL